MLDIDLRPLRFLHAGQAIGTGRVGMPRWWVMTYKWIVDRFVVFFVGAEEAPNCSSMF